MKSSTNPALEPEALYAKSQVYIRRGFRAQSEADTEEYQLWASLALELLGKAALARVHPALVADPTHYQSLFAACGRQLSPDIKTITAKTLYERLSHIEKTFDSRHQKFCEQMALRRNAELHSGESPFSGMSSEVWEREFWGATETVLAMQDETLESWMGAQDAKAPAKIIEQAEVALQWAVKNRVSRCKEAFEKKVQDIKRRREAIEKSKDLSWNDYTWDDQDRAQCPACDSLGTSSGRSNRRGEMVNNLQKNYEISMLLLHGRGVIPFQKPFLPLLGYPVLQSDTAAEYTDNQNRMISLIGI